MSNATAIDREELIELLREHGSRWIEQRGLPIIPCDDKKPIGARWGIRRCNTGRLNYDLLKATNPTIGILMGPKSGIMDLEDDSPDEERAVQHLFRDCEFPVTVFYTSNRGKHRWFKYDERLAVLKTDKKGVFKYIADGIGEVSLRVGAGEKQIQSIIPPSPGREWLLSIDDGEVQPLPEAVIQRLLEQAKSTNVKKGKSTSGTAGHVHAACLTAMNTSTKNIQDGNDGSKRLFVAACRAVEHDLSDSEALATIRAYEAEKPFPKTWTDAEILQRVVDAEGDGKAKRGAAVVICNYEEIEVEGEEGETEKKKVPLMMNEILDSIRQARDHWPRRVDNTLFVDDEHGLSWFDRRTTSGVFGWLRSHHPVDWKQGGEFVTQQELTAELERTAQKYKAIELLPHEPPMEGFYYQGTTPKLGDGSHLKWLLDRFRPETTIDYDLIKAVFMTAMWGGPAGCRPCFVITSDWGRGVGKSTVAQMIGQLFGGHVDVSAGEDIATLKSRMLTPEARTKRIAQIDNIKTLKLSWGELESLVTATTISGRQLYVGEGQRPNVLTWFLTLNGVSLATDMAQRSVIVKLMKGENSGTWM